MTVPVKVAEGEGVAQVGVILALRALLRGHQVQPVPQVLGVGLALPVVATGRPDKQPLLKCDDVVIFKRERGRLC
ncbi:MAG: hypothetical protein ACK559_14380 [bacterium]